MARNFTRSSSGWVVSCAWANTRWLNSSQLSSRLMYSDGSLRLIAGALLAFGRLGYGGALKWLIHDGGGPSGLGRRS